VRCLNERLDRSGARLQCFPPESASPSRAKANTIDNGPMTQDLKAGVIGAGVFGGYHAKKYVELPGVTLVAVFDIDLARAKALAEPLGAQAFDDRDAFLAAVEVVTVATPAVHHAPAVLAALKAGKPVYSEKPLAVTPADADALVAEAARPWACWTFPNSRCAWKPCAGARPRTAISTSRWCWT
jgi:hypothetical protein